MKIQISAHITIVALLSTFFLLESCSPFTKVYSEEEPGVNLSKYHTFNWLNNAEIKKGNSGPEWVSGSTQSKIRAAVEDQMSRYGFKPCDEKPDLMLHFHIVIKNEVLFVHDWSCGGVFDAPGQYDRCHRMQPFHYQEGTLILDFIDTKNGNQVWRGAAVGVLGNLRPEEADARIKDAAIAIFKKYPEKPVPQILQ
ncbi:MAG: DUF4136 domain-containing protein [Saprospiraceae bacterium]